MSTDPRLLVGQDLATGQPVALPKEDVHYLVNVMRRGEGDTVRLFNGRDGEWRARIVEAGRRTAVLEPVEQTRPQRGVPDLWLLFAPVKRQKTDLIVEKATELGAARICPVATERTQSERVRTDRFRIIAKEAAEQTERLDLPEIDELTRLDRMLDGWDPGRRLIYCDEAGDETDAPWGGARGRGRPMSEALVMLEPGPAAILIGPEGGFSAAERDRLRDHDFVTPVTLGPRILRAETAAVAALALWQATHGDWR